MDTLQFLKKILPPSGIYYLVTIREHTNRAGENKTKTDHHAFEYLAAMAEAIEQFDSNPKPGQLGVYHACASYLNESIDGGAWPNGDPKFLYRVPDNHNRAKALWIDIDCGADKAEKGEGYATKKDATVALAKFCRDTGFPAPMVVDSGGGLHCYWPFTKAVPHAAWKQLSAAFKAITKKFGLLADPTATADFARILRPVGSHNTKRGERREVKVLNEGKFRDVTPEEVLANINRIRKQVDLVIPKEPTRSTAPTQGGSDLDDLISKGQQSYPPYSAALAADHCAQIRVMRDMKGDVSYEHWRGVIGFIKVSTDDDSLAFEWSEDRGDTGHTNTDVQTRLNTWNSGPPTCEFFQKCNPNGCQGCEYAGKIKSPAKLGRTITINTESSVEVVEEKGKQVEVEVPPMPAGYRWTGSQIVREIPDKDGFPQDHAVTPARLWAVARVRGTDGRMKLLMRMLMDGGRLKEFYVGADDIAAGGTNLMKALGAYEVYPSTHNVNSTTHLTAYLRDEAEALKRRAQEVVTYDSFGWKDDYGCFVHGGRSYSNDGVERMVLTAGNAATLTEALDRRSGSVEGWAKSVDVLYGRRGMEPLQYALCSAFGAMLGDFQDEIYRGIPVALTSADSGIGKTTVCTVALYAFGEAEGMTISGDENGATDMGKTATIATLKNLPVLIDEITNIPVDKLGAFLYATSNGKDKVRLGVTGGQVALRKPLTWNTSVYLTANTRLQSLLASAKINSAAEAVRIFEIPLDNFDLPRLEDDQFLLAVGAAKRNIGHAGEQYLKHIVQHQERISELIIEEAGFLPKRTSSDDNQYRFYRMHIQCTLAAARLMKDLGLVQFDIDALRTWAHEHLKFLCQSVADNNMASPEDGVSQMMAQLAPDILATYGFRTGKDGFERPINHPRGEIIGRYILGNTEYKELAGRLFLSKKAVRDWCLKNRMDIHSIERVLIENKALLPLKEDRIRLTRGVELPAVQARCYAIDTRKLPGMDVPLTVVKAEEAA